MHKKITPPHGRIFGLMAAASILAIGSLQAQIPIDNPVATHYGPGGYPLWTDNLRWDNVIDMSAYANGATNFERFENARDELHAQGGGVLYYPAGVYEFEMPDAGYGAGIGPKSRGLMLKSGVVIRGADLAPGADQAIIRESMDNAAPGFNNVTYSLAPQTVFRFQTQIRGTDPVTLNPNTAGEAPRDWNFIGMVPGTGEAHVGEVQDIGVVNVKLDGGFVFWGFHTPRSATLATGRWLQGWKSNWPQVFGDPPFEDSWAGRVPDGTHYMDAINGGLDWHTPIEAGSGRLIFGVYSINGAPWDDMTKLDQPFSATAESLLPADAFHSYRYTGRFTAHGTDIFIGNNVLARPTKNFVYRMLQRRWHAGPNAQYTVLFDYSNHIGVDVNKSNYGGRQNNETVVGADTGYHYPNVIVRDNWIFNRGNKGMDIAGQYLVLYNNHNQRLPIGGHGVPRALIPFEYITNPQYYIDNGLVLETGLGTAINLQGVSFDGWWWTETVNERDFMSRGYDIGGRNVWAHLNSAINPGSIGNDGEGVMAQRHNNIETFSWAFTNNRVEVRATEPGTPGKAGTWSGVYDMHAVGYLSWKDYAPTTGWILAAGNHNWILDTTIMPNLMPGGRTDAPVFRRDGVTPAVRYADYQPMHTDPVNPPINVTGFELPDQTGIVITWEDNSDNELGFRVERRMGGGPWQVIAYRPAQNLGAITNKTSPYTTSLSGAELNPPRWVDFTANANMGPEYRVVAFNLNDDDSTGVSLSWFADPDALKVSFPAFPEDEAFVTSGWSSAGITVATAIEDGDGSAVSYSWTQLSGPGTVAFSAPSASSTNMTFSTVGIYRVRVSVSDDSYSTSRNLTVFAGVPLSFISHPESQGILLNNPVTFSASVSGSEPVSYQWYKDGVAIPGADAAAYTIASVQLADAATYSVVASNPVSSVQSDGAVLTVNSAPIFLSQPQSRTAAVNTAVTLSVEVSANPSPTFQWYLDGNPVSGGSGPELVIDPVTLAAAGDYHVVVSNVHGTEQSATATLTVTATDRYLIAWNKEDYALDPAGNVWQSFNMHTGSGNSPPRIITDAPLVNRNGDGSLGFTFSQTSNVTGNNVGYRTGGDVTEALFTSPDSSGRAIPAWFDASEASQRALFAFTTGSYFEYTIGGFDPEDKVTFEFVLRRDGGGNRPITLVQNPGAGEVVLLNQVSHNTEPFYPKTAMLTGATSYTFRLTNNNAGTWGGAMNAMSFEVEYAPRLSAEPEAPVVGVVLAPGAGGLGQLDFPTQVGMTYQLQISEDMSTWDDVPGALIIGDGSTQSFTDLLMPDSTSPELFYRLKVQN
jgi:hypothetical protein